MLITQSGIEGGKGLGGESTFTTCTGRCWPGTRGRDSAWGWGLPRPLGLGSGTDGWGTAMTQGWGQLGGGGILGPLMLGRCMGWWGQLITWQGVQGHTLRGWTEALTGLEQCLREVYTTLGMGRSVGFRQEGGGSWGPLWGL